MENICNQAKYLIVPIASFAKFLPALNLQTLVNALISLHI